jgi:oligoendopeptidase F
MASAKKKASALPTWDLSALYKGIKDPAIARDLATLKKKSGEFAKRYQGKLATILAESVVDYEQLADLSGKLGSYAQLVYAGDMSDTAITQFYQNTSEALNDIGSLLVFYELEINKLSDAAIASAMKSSKTLQRYQPWIEEVRSFRPYQLSDELEQYMHEVSVTDEAWQRLYDESNSRLRFKVGGKSLTEAEALDLLSNKDPKKRKAGAKEVARVYAKNGALFALITNTLAKAKQIDDEKRGFKASISCRNLENQVEDEVVEALISTVKKNYADLSHRYYKWKARQFKQKSLDYWDRNAPLPNADEADFKWKHAVALVQDAYHAFSPELAKVGNQFFEKNWIDVPARAGKASGAFAHPTVPSAHPYLLLNFLGKTRDVMTLAHELGHGVHQVLSNKQGALMCDTPLTLAETASVFGEMLTFQELLSRENNKTRRQRLIASKVEDMLNTVVRQIAFCEFERMVHAERRKGELTVERIGQIWMQVAKESLGPSIKLHSEYSVYWMYIPHFIHTPFYVYAYAFGDCLVNSLYGVYLKEKKAGRGDAFAKKYVNMLQAGGSLRHKELLKPFGLDASKPDFWQAGIDVISGYIDELGA